MVRPSHPRVKMTMSMRTMLVVVAVSHIDARWLGHASGQWWRVKVDAELATAKHLEFDAVHPPATTSTTFEEEPAPGALVMAKVKADKARANHLEYVVTHSSATSNRAFEEEDPTPDMAASGFIFAYLKEFSTESADLQAAVELNWRVPNEQIAEAPSMVPSGIQTAFTALSKFGDGEQPTFGDGEQPPKHLFVFYSAHGSQWGHLVAGGIKSLWCSHTTTKSLLEIFGSLEVKPKGVKILFLDTCYGGRGLKLALSKLTQTQLSGGYIVTTSLRNKIDVGAFRNAFLLAIAGKPKKHLNLQAFFQDLATQHADLKVVSLSQTFPDDESADGGEPACELPDVSEECNAKVLLDAATANKATLEAELVILEAEPPESAFKGEGIPYVQRLIDCNAAELVELAANVSPPEKSKCLEVTAMKLGFCCPGDHALHQYWNVTTTFEGNGFESVKLLPEIISIGA